MKKSLELDLTDVSEIMEGFGRKFEALPKADIIDLAARLKAVAKHCKTIDDYVKNMVKAELDGVEGSIKGGTFKAVLKLVPTTRLDQKALKEEMPKIHAKYNLEVTDERVTFEVK